jgi:hypothetical protein
MAALAVRDALQFGLGWDAQAYFHAWDGPMYDTAPGTWGAYLYSPVVAQVLWPLMQAPWPMFCAVLVLAAAGGIGWLLRPLGWPAAAPLWLACLPEILSGNLYWLMGIAAVLGVRHGAWWTAPALTKVLPCLGPLWFLLRRQWRPLAHAVGMTIAVVAVSFASAPGLWRDWVHLLLSSADAGASVGTTLLPPLGVRLVIGVGLTVVAGLTTRAWLLPVAMLVVSPVVGLGSFAVLAAIPRLHAAVPTRERDREKVSLENTGRGRRV